MKHIFACISLEKQIVQELKKELSKGISKKSFEVLPFRSLGDAINHLSSTNIEVVSFCCKDILVDTRGDEALIELKRRFPHSLSILISSGITEIIINSINQVGLFRCMPASFSVSDLSIALLDSVKHYQKEKEKIERLSKDTKDNSQKELDIAHEIQKNLLLPESPRWKNLDIVCFSESAKNVGGDLYTYFGFQNDKVLISKHIIAVGDVSGKGISAALLMATCLSHINHSIKTNLKLPERMSLLDELLQPFTKPQKQNCALCMVELIGVNTNQVYAKVINAACIPPYIKRKNGTVEWIQSKGFALGQGIGSKFGYKEIKVDIQNGDTIVLVSDGVIEANNSKKELLGFEAFQSILEEAPNHSSKAMLSHIKKRIQMFTNNCEQHDDITIAIVRYHKD